MNKKEFRIGNLVKASQYFDEEEAMDDLDEDYSVENEWDIVRVESIEHKESDWDFVFENIRNGTSPDPEMWNRSEPIDLTEKWLLKFGFISNPYEDRYELGDFHIHCDKTRGKLELWVTNCRQDLIHAHQLQNLYFALTGKELEYSLIN